MSNVQQIDKERHSPPFSFSLNNELCCDLSCERNLFRKKAYEVKS